MEVLNSFLEKNDFKIEELIKFIYQQIPHKSYHHRLHYKKYENDLIQLFSESSLEYTKWDIYNICRSIIFSSKTGKIIMDFILHLEEYSQLKEKILKN